MNWYGVLGVGKERWEKKIGDRLDGVSAKKVLSV